MCLLLGVLGGTVLLGPPPKAPGEDICLGSANISFPFSLLLRNDSFSYSTNIDRCGQSLWCEPPEPLF